MHFLRIAAPLAVLTFATAACGGIVKPADDSPAPATSAVTAVEPIKTDRCLATMTTHGRRPGWVDAGKLTMKTAGRKTTSAELRDVVGRPVKRPPIPSDPGEAKTWMAESVCAVGGYVLVLDPSTVKEAEKGDKTTLEGAIMRPAQENEAGDLQALCKEPKLDLAADTPPFRRYQVATEEYTETLTSRRWRGWLFTMIGYAPPGDASATPTKAQQADELDAAAKAAKIESCWFAKTIRERGSP